MDRAHSRVRTHRRPTPASKGVREAAQLIHETMWNDTDSKSLAATAALLVFGCVMWYYEVDTVLEAWLAPSLGSAHTILLTGYALAGTLVFFNAAYLLRKHTAQLPDLSSFTLTSAERTLLGLPAGTPVRTPAETKVSSPSKAVGSRTVAKNPATQHTFFELQNIASMYFGRLPQKQEPTNVHESSGTGKIMTHEALGELINSTDTNTADVGTQYDMGGKDIRGGILGGTFQRVGMGVNPLQRYKPAKVHMEQKTAERIEDGIVVKDPEQVLVELNIEKHIEEWTRNMRRWVAQNVVSYYANRIVKVDTQLAESKLEKLSCADATLAEAIEVSMKDAMKQAQYQANALMNNATRGQTNSGFNLQQPQQLGSNSATPIKHLVDLMERHPNVPIVKKRLSLESALTIPAYTCRGYIVQRIKKLASSPDLGNFEWDGGSSYNGKEWTPEYYPTDSLLVMHLFCKFMDEKIPANSTVTSPFTEEFYVPLGRKPNAEKSVQIRHYSKNPSHYHTVIEGIAYDCFSGRNNVFSTLCLFAYYISRQWGGHIGVLYTAGPSLNLMDVVKNGPKEGTFATPAQSVSAGPSGTENVAPQ